MFSSFGAVPCLLTPAVIGLLLWVLVLAATFLNFFIFNYSNIFYSLLSSIQVADLCYSKLNLLLLAIEARKFEGGDIYINPKDKIINANAIGRLKFIKEFNLKVL